MSLVSLIQTQGVLRLSFPAAICFLGCLDSESLVKDAAVFAVHLLYGIGRTGQKSTLGNPVFYTIQELHSGRRSTGCVVAGEFQNQFSPWSKPIAVCIETGSEFFLLNQGNDARKLAWETCCLKLQVFSQIMPPTGVDLIVDGNPALNTSSSAVQWRNDALSESIGRFKGKEILLEVRRSPPWRNQLVSIASHQERHP